MTPVCLQLCLAGAARTDAAAQTGKRGSTPGKARQKIAQLRQFHLQLAFARACARRKNVENQHGAVHHAHVCGGFQVADLRRRQLTVKNQQFNLMFPAEVRNFPNHTASHTGGCVQCRALLRHGAEGFCACAARQCIQLRQGCLCIIFACIARDKQRAWFVFGVVVHKFPSAAILAAIVLQRR